MAQGPEAALPPYFGISPDEALAELDPAGRHPRLRRDRRRSAPAAAPTSSRRGHEASGAQDAAAVLDLGDHPLPDPGRHRPTSAGCCAPTPRCRRAAPRPRAAPSGSPSTRSCGCARTSPPRAAAPRTTAPYRPAGLPAKICAVANFKGGVGKTSMAAHLAMSAALDGYRVLVVDLDSQGSMTSIFGGRVASEWDTVFPLIARDYALGLQAENRRRVERGDPPLPLEEMLDAALGKSAADVVQKTHWPNIDLDRRPAQPLLGRVPDPGLAHVPARLEALGGARQRASSATACSTAYDLVILDTPPALGYLTINGLTAADILLVPLGRQLPRVRLDGALLRHAALDLRIDRGRREHRRPRPRPRRDPLRVGRGPRRRHPLRRRPAGRARRADAGLPRPHPLALAPGLHRAGRPGRRAGRRHLRGRLPRLQPRHLRPRPPDLRRRPMPPSSGCSLAAWRRDELARRPSERRPPDGPPPPDPRRAARSRGPRAAATRPVPTSPRLAASPRRSPGSPPRPPAPPRCRSSPTRSRRARDDRPHGARPRRSTPSPPTTWPATACPPRTPRWPALRESLRAHGQRTPIEVTPAAPGALPYGLISGWRRLAGAEGAPRRDRRAALRHRPGAGPPPGDRRRRLCDHGRGERDPPRPQPVRARPRRGAAPPPAASSPARRRRCCALFATASRPEALAHPRLPRDLPRPRRARCASPPTSPSASASPSSSACAPATARARRRRPRHGRPRHPRGRARRC